MGQTTVPKTSIPKVKIRLEKEFYMYVGRPINEGAPKAQEGAIEGAPKAQAGATEGAPKAQEEIVTSIQIKCSKASRA